MGTSTKSGRSPSWENNDGHCMRRGSNRETHYLSPPPQGNLVLTRTRPVLLGAGGNDVLVEDFLRVDLRKACFVRGAHRRGVGLRFGWGAPGWARD